MVETNSASSTASRHTGGGEYEEYHPYGTTAWWAEKSGIDVSRKRYRYTGQEKDEETGLCYHHHRYYMPWLGRWASADPAGLVDGPNRWGYCSSSPADSVDHKGLDTQMELSQEHLEAVWEANRRAILDHSPEATAVAVPLTEPLVIPFKVGMGWLQDRQLVVPATLVPSAVGLAMEGLHDSHPRAAAVMEGASMVLQDAAPVALTISLSRTATSLSRDMTRWTEEGVREGVGGYRSRPLGDQVAGAEVASTARLDLVDRVLAEVHSEFGGSTLYHRGRLDGGAPRRHEDLSTTPSRAYAESITRESDQLWEVNLSAEAIAAWERKGLLETLTDYDHVSGVSGPEVRIAVGALDDAEYDVLLNAIRRVDE